MQCRLTNPANRSIEITRVVVKKVTMRLTRSRRKNTDTAFFQVVGWKVYSEFGYTPLMKIMLRTFQDLCSDYNEKNQHPGACGEVEHVCSNHCNSNTILAPPDGPCP